MITLDRHNPNQVSSWQDMEVTLVDPTRRARILSGIAIPEFYVNDDDRSYPDQCVVSLGITVPDFIQATCQVGLASISNDDTAFHFGLNDCWVEPDPDSGELKLHVNLDAKGEGTSLSRFGFQIVALYGKRITGIYGQIRWSRALLNLRSPGHGRSHAGHVSVDVSSLVRIHAYLEQPVMVPDPIDGRFVPSPHEIDLGYVTPSGTITTDGDDSYVEYAFEHLPLGVPLRIVGTDLSTRFPSDAEIIQISGPNPVTLTPAHLTERVDFRIREHRGPA